MEQIYARVFRELKPRTAVPAIRIHFRKYANANAQIKLANGQLELRLADTLALAPEPVMEALAWILLSKLFRRPIPKAMNERYRRYLNHKDVRKDLEQVRRARGRKQIESPQGECYNLDDIFDQLNFHYFFGLMAKPALGWSPNASRTMLGHYDPSHHAIVLSRVLDRPQVREVVVEYVMFHEMLHLRHPVEHRGVRRCVHTKAFKEAEKQFERLAEAKALLRHL